MDGWISVLDVLFTQSQHNSHITIITFNNRILHDTTYPYMYLSLFSVKNDLNLLTCNEVV